MLRRDTNQILVAILGDALIVLVSVVISLWLRFNLSVGLPMDFDTSLFVIWTVEALILYPLINFLLGVYDPDRSFHASDEYQQLTIANSIAGLALAGLVFFSVRGLSRLLFLYFFTINYLLTIGWREVFRRSMKNQGNANRHVRKVLLVGDGDSAHQTLAMLKEYAWAGVQLVGMLAEDAPGRKQPAELPYLGDLPSARQVIHDNQVDDVVIALPGESYAVLKEMVKRLIDQPCNIWVVPDYMNLLIYGSRVDNLQGVSMISLKAPTLTGYQRMLKRIFDLLISGLTVLLTWPLMAVIALVIKLDSPGPAILRQKRAGENGRLFEMLKFRTMYLDADERLNEVLRYDDDGNLIHKSPHDPRVTRAGRILRRTSLDELPQFINVLRGEMSLVGPRPELPLLVAQYEPWQQKRFAVPQGITGWWQVNGRSDKPMHLNTEDDLYYVQNYSLRLDIEIILKTLWVVLRGKGAY